MRVNIEILMSDDMAWHFREADINTLLNPLAAEVAARLTDGQQQVERAKSLVQGMIDDGSLRLYKEGELNYFQVEHGLFAEDDELPVYTEKHYAGHIDCFRAHEVDKAIYMIENVLMELLYEEIRKEELEHEKFMEEYEAWGASL